MPRVAAERPETGRVFGARSEQRSSAIVMLAVSPRLDFAVLFDSWLLNEAEVEPANYIAHVPRSHILADGWYVWDADPSDGFGPVMAHVGATPDAFAALAMLEWHTWGSESWYRMAMADDIGLAFVRPPRLVP